jgi:capsular polysaccharide biosynthesis protein
MGSAIPVRASVNPIASARGALLHGGKIAIRVGCGPNVAARTRLRSPVAQPPTFSPEQFEGGFEPYLQAVRRHPLIVALVTLAALAGSVAWLAARSPEYRATAQVLVTPMPFNDPTFAGLPVLKDTPGDPVRAVNTAAGMLESPAAAAAAAQALGHGWTQGRVAGAVTIATLGGTNVLGVQAVDRNGTTAADVARAYAAASVEQRRQSLARQANALVAQLKSVQEPDAQRVSSLVTVARGFDPTFSLASGAPAIASARRSNWRIVAAALIAGLVLGIGAALIVDHFGRRR